MAKKKYPGILALLLIVGIILAAPGLAADDPVQPGQDSLTQVGQSVAGQADDSEQNGAETSGRQATVEEQVYGAGGSESEGEGAPAGQPDPAVEEQAYSGNGLENQIVYAAQSVPDQIILSWTGDPQATQTVAWRADSAVTGGKVQYMKESEKTEDFSGALEKEAVLSELYTGFNHFEAGLDNLEPGVTYAYRAGGEGGWSEAGAFTTAAPTDDFSFMFMGDIHVGYNTNSAGVWRQLLDQALSNYPDLKFTLQVGDLVDETTDVTQWEEFFNTEAGVFDHIPLLPAIGNHEFEDAIIYLKSFALPQNGPEGLKEHHYSFDYGNAHFVVLDSNMMGSEGALSEAGLNWLESDLRNSDKTWKFVMFHHPPYGVDSRDVTQGNMIKSSWAPIMEQNGVDMAFVGHQHFYMRTYPISGGEIQEQTEGITYVLGNAGNKTYLNPEEHDYITKIFEGTNSTSYTIIDIDGDVLSMTTRGADGAVIDEFKINKRSDMDSRVAISGITLLDSSYQEITSVPTGGQYRLRAHLNNYTSETQTANAVIQVRGGDDAAADCGGEPLGIASLQADVAPSGADVYADFTMSGLSAGSKAYVDVYVLDEASVPIDDPYQGFSFDITS